MTIDDHQIGHAWVRRHRRRPANGGGRPVLEVDQVTKIYPSEPPVTALRESPSRSGGASWWASSARRDRASPRCCI